MNAMHRNTLFVFLLTLLVSVFVAYPAFAQVVAARGVDFTPVAEQIIAVAVTVLTVLAGFVSRGVIGWLASKTKMQDTQFEALLADRVSDILMRSIDYAEAWAKREVADPNSPLKNVEINNFFVEQAVRYAMRSMPDLISYFNLTEERLADMVRSRLNGVTGAPQVNSGTLPHALSPADNATPTDDDEGFATSSR